jgi:hypothetical protein
MTGSIGFRIRVSGRVGPRLCEVLAGLDVEPVSGHTVLTVGSEDLRALHALLVELERRGIEVEKVRR